jgi:hypothetical protein
MNDHASPEVAAAVTIGSVLTDLVDVAERIPVQPDRAEATARIVDRLAEELTEASAMIRRTAAPAAAFPTWREEANENATDAFASDERVIRARALLAEHHQPLVMTPGDLRQLLVRYHRRLGDLIEIIDGGQR